MPIVVYIVWLMLTIIDLSLPPCGHRCRVVVSTCMTAGFLHSLRLPVGHFSHVIVDEAGQATEPEALLSATLLSNTTGQVFIPPSSPPSSFVAALLSPTPAGPGGRPPPIRPRPHLTPCQQSRSLPLSHGEGHVTRTLPQGPSQVL